MQPRLECTVCGRRFHSSIWKQMLSEGERCTCGGPLRSAELEPPEQEPEGKADRAPYG